MTNINDNNNYYHNNFDVSTVRRSAGNDKVSQAQSNLNTAKAEQSQASGESQKASLDQADATDKVNQAQDTHSSAQDATASASQAVGAAEAKLSAANAMLSAANSIPIEYKEGANGEKVADSSARDAAISAANNAIAEANAEKSAAVEALTQAQQDEANAQSELDRARSTEQEVQANAEKAAQTEQTAQAKVNDLSSVLDAAIREQEQEERAAQETQQNSNQEQSNSNDLTFSAAASSAIGLTENEKSETTGTEETAETTYEEPASQIEDKSAVITQVTTTDINKLTDMIGKLSGSETDKETALEYLTDLSNREYDTTDPNVKAFSTLVNSALGKVESESPDAGTMSANSSEDSTKQESPASQLKDQIQNMLDSDNPDAKEFKELFNVWGGNNDANLFDVLGSNAQVTFDKIKEKFSTEESQDILSHIGAELAEQIEYDLTYNESHIGQDYSKITKILEDNLKKDKDGCSLTQSFVKNLSIKAKDLTWRYPISTFKEAVENSSIPSDKQESIWSKWESFKDVEQKTVMPPASKYIKDGSENAAFYNGLRDKDNNQIGENIQDAGDEYNVTYNGAQISVKKSEVEGQLGLETNTAIMKLAMQKYESGDVNTTATDKFGNPVLAQGKRETPKPTTINKGLNLFYSNTKKMQKVLDNLDDKVVIASFNDGYNKNCTTFTDSITGKEHTISNSQFVTVDSSNKGMVTIKDPENPNKKITLSKKDFLAKIDKLEYYQLKQT